MNAKTFFIAVVNGLLIFHSNLNSSVIAQRKLNRPRSNSSDSNSLFEKLPTTTEHKTNLTREKLVVQEKTDLHRKWLSEMFEEAKSKFEMHPKVSNACRRDYAIYKQNALNQTVWAVRMMESSEWPEVGLFSGSTFNFGDYAECLKSEAPRFRGKYCLVGATFHIHSHKSDFEAVGRKTSTWIKWPNENASAWDVINEYESNMMRYSRQMFGWAVCIPSSCSSSDLQISLSKSLTPVLKANNIRGQIITFPSICKVQKALNYPLSYHIVKFILLFLIILVILATTYDINTRKSGINENNEGNIWKRWLLELLACFSMVKNSQILTHHSANTFPVLYLLKLFLIWRIILGHELLYSAFAPRFETEQMEMLIYKPWSTETVGHVTVTGFLVISGFLMAYFGNRKVTEIGILQVLLSIVCRWSRLVPAVGVTLLVFTFVMPYMGDGPLWDPLVQNAVIDPCTSNWWTNLLLVNNIVNPDKMCMTHSWYISVDFQLSVIGSAFVFVTNKSKKLGVFMMFLLFIGSEVTTFLRIYRNKIYGPLMVYPNLLKMKNPMVEQYDKIYLMTYFRAGPYFVGFATALLTKALKEKSYKFSSVQKAFWLIPSFVIGFGAQLYVFVFYKNRRPYSAFENAVFGMLQQILFAIPLACVICIHLVSGLGALNKLIEFHLNVPLGRLVYSMYLVSYPIQMFHTMSAKKPNAGSLRTEGYWRAGTDLIYSGILAFFLFMIAERPANNISALLYQYIIKMFKKSGRKETDFQEESSVGQNPNK